jgi:predicted transcriptional regulator
MSNERGGYATVGNLFDLLLAPVSHCDLEVAGLLGIGVEPLRDRMKDLRKRGLVAGPFRDSQGMNWKLGFSTGVEARTAARESGLDPDASVALGESSWNELARESKRVVALVSNQVRRWLHPPSAN